MGLFSTIWLLLVFISAVWVIYDVWANQKKLKTGIQVLWTLLVLLGGIITAIVYYFFYHHKK